MYINWPEEREESRVGQRFLGGEEGVELLVTSCCTSRYLSSLLAFTFLLTLSALNWPAPAGGVALSTLSALSDTSDFPNWRPKFVFCQLPQQKLLFWPGPLIAKRPLTVFRGV